MKKLLLLSASVAAISFGSAANAQSMDYATMQELFGEPVTTSGNGSPQRVSDVALNMEILTAEDIARTGARTIPQALRFMPGVDVRRHSFGQYEVGIRGYNQPGSERILVLVNGRQVYSDFFGQVVWDSIPVEMGEIQQIEVVKGPNTALFGFNAVSGVINIITYNPLHDDQQFVEGRFGTHSLTEGSASYIGKFSDRFGVRTSVGGYRSTEDFDDVENQTSLSGIDTSIGVHDTHRESFVVDAWAQLTDNVQGQFEVSRADSGRNEILATKGASATDYRASSVRGRILADTTWGLIEADLYHNEMQADYDLLLSSGVTPLEADNRVTVAKLNNTFEVGADHILRVAGEYRSGSNIFASSAASLDQDDLKYDIWSASALWDWTASEKIRTSVAVRYDDFELKPDGPNFVAPGAIGAFSPFTDADFNQEREEVSYNLGLTYKLDDISNVKLTTSRGADLPSFTEFGLQFFSVGTTSPSSGIYGNPYTDTSIVTNYEIAYDRKIEDIRGNMRAALFYQQSDDMQAFGADVYQLAGPVDIAQIGNIGDSEMFGFELGFDGLYKDRWNWAANYTFLNINDDFRNQQNSAERSSVSAYEDTVSNHIFNAHIGYTADKWRTDLFAQYRTSFDDTAGASATANNQYVLEEINDQVIVNVSFAYDITDKLEWSVSGTSITGDTQQTLEGDTETTVFTALKYTF